MAFKFTHKAADIPGTCNSQDASLPRFHLKEFHYIFPTNLEDPVVILKENPFFSLRKFLLSPATYFIRPHSIQSFYIQRKHSSTFKVPCFSSHRK